MKRSTYLVPLLTVCLSAIALSACQPTSQETESPSSSTSADTTDSTDPTINNTTTPEAPLATDPTSSAPLPPPSPSRGDKMAPDLSELQRSYTTAISKMNDEMQLMLSMNNVDVAFARGMLGHHRAARELNRLEERYGINADLKLLANQITATEEAEIDALKRWLASHPDTRELELATEQTRPAYHYAIDAMSGKMIEAIMSADPDIAFAKAMLAHHRGAEAMAKIQLQYGSDPEMKALAAQIIKEQLPEMEQLIAWLKSRGIEMNPRLVPLPETTNDSDIAETTDAATTNRAEMMTGSTSQTGKHSSAAK